MRERKLLLFSVKAKSLIEVKTFKVRQTNEKYKLSAL